MLKRKTEREYPCATPINNFDELFSWEGGNEYYIGVAPLEPCQRDENLPRTLVCHDMAGGYLEDRFVQGSGKYDAYRFYHWHLVDTFVYFSHHMITIPPPCWINAAHKHGVPVLGTFITEWDDGYKKCEKLLSHVPLIERVVDQMVNIAVQHSMDGWLINIENDIQLKQITNLILFVRLLTERMHMAKPMSKVIWYDSVTIDGKLCWQNELNELNHDFFEQCDAIFLNYTWKNENLINSALNCRGRLHDVFVGVDVFGRGMIGGGGYNTKEALDLARKAQLSIALFAPGWVYEVNGSREFDANEERFWYYLQPYLPMHVSCSLPLASSFCQGWGKRTYMYGQSISNEPWSNLSMQQPQPTLTHSEMGHNPHQQYKWLHLDDGFMGGGAMRFIGRLPNTGRALSYRIFDTAIIMETSAYVKYTMKRMHAEEGARLFVYLVFNKDEEQEERFLLPEEEIMTTIYSENENDTTIDSLPHADIPAALNTPNHARDVGNWQLRVFHIDADLIKGKSLDEVGLLAYTQNPEPLMLNVLLGSLQILPSNDATLAPMPVTNITCDEVVLDHVSTRSDHTPEDALSDKCLSMILLWDQPDIDADVTSYHIWHSINGSDRVWLGATYTNKFFISDLQLEGEKGTIQFNVQVLYKSGVMQDLNESGKFLFAY